MVHFMNRPNTCSLAIAHREVTPLFTLPVTEQEDYAQKRDNAACYTYTDTDFRPC